jgi:ribonucleoside-diphosphate reductase, beta subunit|nr:MAG TPA: Ribonucleotide reductase, small chain [Caudoviricetes sp.]
MGIFDKREAYKPFEYPEVTRFTDAMSKSYWVHSEVEFTADVQDYKVNLTDVEREALKRSLLGIAQIEVSVKTFWGDLYKMFPKPEFNNLGMSFGESECFDKYTEILTNNGYKRFENLTDEDKVAQYNMEDKSISFVKPLRRIKRHYKGKMHYYQNSTIDLMVTPNHEVVTKRDDSDKFMKIKSCNVKYKDSNVLPISGYKDGDKEFTALDKLLVALYFCGDIYRFRLVFGRPIPSPGFSFVFNSDEKAKIEKIEELLNELNIEYEKSNTDCGKILIHVAHFEDIDLVSKIEDLSYINIEEVSKGWIDKFINELEYWNGHVDGLFVHRYPSEKSIDTISTLCVLSGRRSQNSGVLHSIKYGNYWSIMIEKGDECSYPLKEEVDYDDFVYCVEVPTGCVVVRRNKSVCISGNCRHSEAYARLLEVLGYNNEFEHILDIPVFKKRYHVLKDYLNENKDNVMEKLLFFTLVVENASLFSQFATILYFSRFKGYMKNVANIIAWSSTDEACLKLNTEVLTPQGWRFIKDMKVGDDIYGFKEGELRDEKVLKTIRKSFEGSLHTIHNSRNSIVATPDHELIYNKYGKWGKMMVKDFKRNGWIRFPNSANYVTEGDRQIFTDLDRLKIAIQADGCKIKNKRKNGEVVERGSNGGFNYSVGLYKQRKIDRFESLLESVGIKYSKTPHRDGFHFSFHLEYMSDYKSFSWVDFSNVDKKYAEQFIEEVLEWDGSRVNDNLCYVSTRKDNIDIVQRLAILAGYRTHIGVRPDNRKDTFKTTYKLSFFRKDLPFATASSFKNTINEPTKEDVVCVTVPSGGIIVRQDEYSNPFIIGNCHAQAGTWILSKIFEEQPEFREKAEKEATSFIQEYIKMEDELLDWIFEQGELDHVKKKDLGNYMRYRLNSSFKDLKLPPPFELTEEDIKPMMWFEEEVFSNELDDFFAKRPVAYTKHDKSITANDLF